MFGDVYQRGKKCLRLEKKMVHLFPIQQLSFSENRSQDVKTAHDRAYRSIFFHVGLAACLENL